MSRSARVTAPFGDGVYVFRLDIAGLEELDEKCDAGPEELYQRISEGRWRVRDIRETLRIGLVRGGAEPVMALALVNRYAAEGYLLDLKALALNVLGASILGAPEEDRDQPSGGVKARAKDPSRAEKSGSAASTRPVRRSASHRKTSGDLPSGS